MLSYEDTESGPLFIHFFEGADLDKTVRNSAAADLGETLPPSLLIPSPLCFDQTSEAPPPLDWMTDSDGLTSGPDTCGR